MKEKFITADEAAKVVKKAVINSYPDEIARVEALILDAIKQNKTHIKGVRMHEETRLWFIYNGSYVITKWWWNKGWNISWDGDVYIAGI
jgi:hypothetical protein